MGYDISAHRLDNRGGLSFDFTKPYAEDVRQVLRALGAEDLYAPTSGPNEYREYSRDDVRLALLQLKQDGFQDRHVLDFLDRMQHPPTPERFLLRFW